MGSLPSMTCAVVTLWGFANRPAGIRWRKRFSEDLVQVLNRLGTFGLNGVDLRLRDLSDGRVFVIEECFPEGGTSQADPPGAQ